MSEVPVRSSRLPALVHFPPLLRIKRQRKSKKKEQKKKRKKKIGDG